MPTQAGGGTAESIVAALVAHWRSKVLYGLALYAIIWPLYLCLQRYHLPVVTPIRPTWLDAGIPFRPDFVILYESIFLLAMIPPWLMTTMADLRRYCWGILGTSLIAFLFFAVFPTQVTRLGNAETSNVLYQALIRIDGELNALPSLHAAFSVYLGAYCHRMFPTIGFPWLRWLAWAWVAAILASILLTKQHLIVDTVAGGLLGAGMGFIFSRTTGTTNTTGSAP